MFYSSSFPLFLSFIPYFIGFFIFFVKEKDEDWKRVGKRESTDFLYILSLEGNYWGKKSTVFFFFLSFFL